MCVVPSPRPARTEVLSEVKQCTKAFPDCYIRVAGFDNIKQVQCASFLVHRSS